MSAKIYILQNSLFRPPRLFLQCALNLERVSISLCFISMSFMSPVNTLLLAHQMCVISIDFKPYNRFYRNANCVRRFKYNKFHLKLILLTNMWITYTHIHIHFHFGNPLMFMIFFFCIFLNWVFFPSNNCRTFSDRQFFSAVVHLNGFTKALLICWKGQIILLISWVIFFIIASISFVIIVVVATITTAAGTTAYCECADSEVDIFGFSSHTVVYCTVYTTIINQHYA